MTHTEARLDSTLVAYKKGNSCLCHKARFTQRMVVWTFQPFVRTNPRILIKSARRNIKQKNPQSSYHLQKDTLDFGKKCRQKSLEFKNENICSSCVKIINLQMLFQIVKSS